MPKTTLKVSKSKTAATLGILGASLTVALLGIAKTSAPHAATAYPTLGGCQLFPSDNVWNYDISSLPVDPNSSAYITHIGTVPLLNDFGDTPSWGIPYNVVPGNTPFVPIHFTTYAAQSVPGPYPIPANALVEQGSDQHVLVLDQGNCKLYELWSASVNQDGSWTAQSGTVFDLSSDTLVPPGMLSADAGNFAITPGLIKYDETASGPINHAIRVVINDPQDTYVWPATHTDGLSTCTCAPPYGTRFRLKASVDVSSYSPTNQVILNALKHYGMIVADKSNYQPEVSLVGAPDSRWDWQDLALLKNIPMTDFEAIDESALETSANSGAVKNFATTPGDINGDGHVSILDLSILLSHYGQSSVTKAQGDLNGDSIVGITDLSILLSNFGT